ncbi:MAG: transcriptional regulator [Candidatus Cloacimonadota bacterium]|nr:MAG: transcriptional regulator [Candidatus Cloacimonadota bacterium]
MHKYANMKKWKFGIGYDPLSLIFKALSCDQRINIIRILKYGEQSVSEIASFLSIHQSVVSRHLYILQSAGLIVSRKKGVEVYYKLSSPKTLELLKSAEEIIEIRKKLMRL